MEREREKQTYYPKNSLSEWYFQCLSGCCHCRLLCGPSILLDETGTWNRAQSMNHMICKLGRGRKNPLDLRPFLLINRWVDCPRDIGLAFPLSLSSILIWKALSRQIYGLEGKRKVNQRDCVQEQDCCRRMKALEKSTGQPSIYEPQRPTKWQNLTFKC